MRTLILGWADENGNGKPVLVAAPHLDPVEQIEIMDKASRLQKFPKDISRLEYFTIPDEPAQIAIHLGTAVGEAIAAAEARRDKQEKQNSKAAVAITETANAIAAAEQKVKHTARIRNELMGKLNHAQTHLRNHDLTSENLRNPNWAKNVADLKKVVFGDPKEKVTGLEDQVKQAISDYEKAVAEFESLTKPLNEKLTSSPKPQMQL